jgi:BirA family transcriptional regulator, biotin operon repressor / biotin---[acetyl-CoA-carboxylase] ligase
MSEPLPEELRAALATSAERRGPFGQPAVFFSETGSTNDVAAAMAEQAAPEGAMVVALAQTAGRGRLGRAWFSPPGAGLYVSVICRNAMVAPLLTLAGGVAVADGIRGATALPVEIKWPNDIVIPDSTAPGRRRKLAGILAEGSSGANGLQYVVLGFGINLRPAPYPASIATRATSIEAELGRPVEAGAILAETLSVLNEQVTALAHGQSERVLARWRAMAPTSVGGAVEWTADGHVHRGTTAGIDDDGALRVRRGPAVDRIIAGEVVWL